MLISRKYRPGFSVFFSMSNIKDLMGIFFPGYVYVHIHLFIVRHSGHHFEAKLGSCGSIMNALTQYPVKVYMNI